MLYELGRIRVEWFRNPIKLELVRHVVPLGLFIFFIALSLGYAWARAAYMGFMR